MPDEQARPDARSHVPADQVSDLLEGLLPADEAAAVAAHLSACAQCAEVRDRLAAMPALLATARTDDPMVSMPADVAARLDRALAAEARNRAAGPEEQVAEVVPISRAGRTRKVFAGLVAAAAVVVGFVVVGDVVGGSDDGGGGDTSAADSGAEPEDESGDAKEDAATKLGETSASPVLVQVSVRDFGADVTGLLAGSARSTTAPDGAVAGGDAAPTACTPAQLDAAGVTGSDGPVVLLEDAPVTLVTSGPRGQRLVVAYSCDGGSPSEQARAVVDLTG